MSAQDLLEIARSGAPYDTQLEAIDERLRPFAREGVVLHHGDGRSVFGGDGPKFEGAEDFWFIAAVDLADVPHLDPLPEEGHLRFYWDDRVAEYERMDFVAATRVAHVPGPAPEVPGGIALSGLRMPIVGAVDELDDTAYDALDDLMGAYRHQLLGNSRDIQGPALAEVPYWFKEGFPETRERYSEAELRGEGWTLLAQFDSDGDLMFGDAGALYFVVPEADLRERRFDRVMGIMQCS
jgi:uncharacterized protein YwqG